MVNLTCIYNNKKINAPIIKSKSQLINNSLFYAFNYLCIIILVKSLLILILCIYHIYQKTHLREWYRELDLVYYWIIPLTFIILKIIYTHDIKRLKMICREGHIIDKRN